MANYRVISITFWTDAKVYDDFTPEDKYFYLYLLTNPHTNICGCYEISMKQMERETGYNDDTIKRLIDRMQRIHNVIRYSLDTKELLILNWGKYNWTKSEKLIKAVDGVSQYIKNAEFKNFVQKKLKNPKSDTDTESDTDVSIGYQYPIDTVSDKPQRHKYGEYKHVLLSDDEYSRLIKDYGEQLTAKYIRKVDEYCEQIGKGYKNYNLTVRKFMRSDGIKTTEEYNQEKGTYEEGGRTYDRYGNELI